jgi:hypothetical protein
MKITIYGWSTKPRRLAWASPWMVKNSRGGFYVVLSPGCGDASWVLVPIAWPSRGPTASGVGSLVQRPVWACSGVVVLEIALQIELEAGLYVIRERWNNSVRMDRVMPACPGATKQPQRDR